MVVRTTCAVTTIEPERAAIGQSEFGTVPIGWATPRLRDGIELLSGHHVLAQFCNTEGRGVPYITGPADFPEGKIQQTKYTTRPSTMCLAGDILVTVKGSGAGKLTRANQTYCISRQLMAVRVRDWNATFVEYALRDSKTISSAATGLIPGISREDILNTTIALPETNDEQDAIAEALSDADALIESLEDLITKKRAIKQGAMQELISGQRRLPGYTKRWAASPLGSVCRSIVDGTHFTPMYVESGIPFYSVENVTADDFINTKFISPQEHRVLLRRCKPERGDILLTRIGAIGDTKLIDWDVDASIYVSLALLKCGDGIEPAFLHAYTKSKQFVRDLEERSLLNAAPRKINMGEIGKVLIPLPNADEQRAIAEVLDAMDAEIVALEEKFVKAHQIKQGMMQDLLTGRVRLV